MWKLNTFEGEKIFYEAELIDFIKKLCLENMQNNELYGICEVCVHGKINMAQRILELIQENEG